MRKFVLCLICLPLAALLPLSALAEEVRGFDTPEACAQAIFDALKTQDLELMESCVAFDEMASSFDYQAQAERMQAAMGISSFLPATDTFSCEFNASLLRRNWYLRVSSLILYAADPTLAGLLFDGRVYAAKSGEYAKIMEAVDTLDTDNVLWNVEYLGTVAPQDLPSIADIYMSDKNQQTMKSIMSVWGVEIFTELALKLRWTGGPAGADGTDYLIPIRFVQIGGRWLADPNPSVLAAILGLNAANFALPMP